MRTAVLLAFLIALPAWAEDPPAGAKEAVETFVKGVAEASPDAMWESLGRELREKMENAAAVIKAEADRRGDSDAGYVPRLGIPWAEAAKLSWREINAIRLREVAKEWMGKEGGAPKVGVFRSAPETWVVIVDLPGAEPATLHVGQEGDAWKIVEIEGAGMRPGRRVTNEVSAQGSLKQLVSTEGVWRQTDSDRNGAQDYWTRDVAGYYYIQDANEQLLKYIDLRLARADRLGIETYGAGPPEPKSGYWLRAMKTDEEGRPYIDEELPAPSAKPVADRPSTNSGKFAFCAYPAEYGVSGTKSYIVNEEGVLYEKDLGPDATDGCDTWPDADPTTKGWVASE